MYAVSLQVYAVAGIACPLVRYGTYLLCLRFFILRSRGHCSLVNWLLGGVHRREGAGVVVLVSVLIYMHTKDYTTQS